MKQDLITNTIHKSFKVAKKVMLPTDAETEQWYEENIDKGCSPSSAIYKFRLWLKDRSKQLK